MISPDINDFGVFFFEHPKNGFNKTAMFFLPSDSFFLNLPSIDDVSVQNELFTGDLFKEPGYFFGFGMF